MQSLTPHYKALIIGSSGAIGNAFVKALNLDSHCSGVEQVCRANSNGFNLLDEKSIENALLPVKSKGPFDLIIDATGALTINGKGPEKSLQSIQGLAFNDALWVNCIGPTVVLKSLVPLLSQKRCIYAKLSARVGSITDNSLGGWYSYRASKAAFNMVLQTAAIEQRRKNPHAIFVALQPGTVASPLSTPFVNPAKALTPEDSVRQMLEALDALEPTQGAQFIDYKGERIAW
jgi:NAD(P)-dependent dehydrogenase (short-subunit alcohol dehydrogenase family)